MWSTYPAAWLPPACALNCTSCRCCAARFRRAGSGRPACIEDAALGDTFAPGKYEAVFHVAAYYRDQGVPLPPVPFLDVVAYRFGIADPAQHYHLPFKVTPWGYSCFRGGA